MSFSAIFASASSEEVSMVNSMLAWRELICVICAK